MAVLVAALRGIPVITVLCSPVRLTRHLLEAYCPVWLASTLNAVVFSTRPSPRLRDQLAVSQTADPISIAVIFSGQLVA